MTSRLNPYLSFDGNAKEAMEFYRSVLGGELDVSTFGEFGAAETDAADKIMHARLETPSGFVLMGADLPPGEPYRPGDTISVSLSGDDAEELRGWFRGLSDGGQVRMPLEVQMWGDEFGMVLDRYGIGWMVNIFGGRPA